jgi:hypothetical protein
LYEQCEHYNGEWEAGVALPDLVTGMDIGADIAHALGLPPQTKRIEIHIGVDELVEVHCFYYPDSAAVRKLLTVLGRYQVVTTHHIVPREPTSPTLGEP